MNPKNRFTFVVQTTIVMTTRVKNEDMLHLLTGRTPLGINRLLSYYLKLADIALTREQWSIMAVLWKKDGLTQQMIADKTYRDRPGTTRLLDNLEKEGYVERRPHESDRRTKLIFLTSKGKKIESEVVKALNDTIQTVTKNVSNHQIETLRNTFEQINQNIQEQELKLAK